MKKSISVKNTNAVLFMLLFFKENLFPKMTKNESISKFKVSMCEKKLKNLKIM